MANYISDKKGDRLKRSYSIIDDNEKVIGSIEGYCNEYGDLVAVVKIYPGHQKKGLGFEAFKKIFDELNSVVPIKRIIGSWHRGGEFGFFEDGMSTNMKIFLECLAHNENPEQCAFSTPTGKWAKQLGFTICKIVQKSLEDITVHFLKSNDPTG
jgi:hypothetical protein